MSGSFSRSAQTGVMCGKEERVQGAEREKGASPTECTAGLLSSVRREESNWQEPNY